MKINNNEGFDICYGCGKVFGYGTLKDLDESFAIYCKKCKPELYGDMLYIKVSIY